MQVQHIGGLCNRAAVGGRRARRVLGNHQAAAAARIRRPGIDTRPRLTVTDIAGEG